MSKPIAIFWFRKDLRLKNHPALTLAAKEYAVLPLYILDTEDEKWGMGPASAWWLHHSLKELQNQLKSRSPLVLKRGSPQEILLKLCEETHAKAVFWSKCYEPYELQRDSAIQRVLKSKNIYIHSEGSLLEEPDQVLNKNGEPFKVFSAFWKTLSEQVVAKSPLPIPDLHPAKCTIRSQILDDWKLDCNWHGQTELWSPGAEHAEALFQHFLQKKWHSYGQEEGQMHFLSNSYSSTLSAHLHFGEISPYTLWWEVMQRRSDPFTDPFLRQIGWREFSYGTLFFFPYLAEESYTQKFSRFAWNDNPKHFEAWCQGKTGYPIVDAGMRQLLVTGTMPNRVRMIVASFLTKHLRIHWLEGAKWFWQTLLDADLAINSMNWQWVAGTGLNAAPYFRIFNPTTQGRKFDPYGEYVRKWVPELNQVDDDYVHTPWLAEYNPYIAPIVDHEKQRAEALSYYSKL